MNTFRSFFHRKRHTDPSQDEIDATAVKNMKLEDVLEVFNTLVHPSSESRKKLSVHVVSKQLDPQAMDAVRYHEGVEVIGDEALFKARMHYSPAPIPVLQPPLDTVRGVGETGSSNSDVSSWT